MRHPNANSLEKIMRKVEKTDGCWHWLGSTNRKGYGKIFYDWRPVGVHRFFYETFVGPIPEGLTIDHLCKNPSCVRPDHLEAVTYRENNLRGGCVSAVNARKTHCKYGHPLAGENLRVSVTGRYKRRCRTCERAKGAAYYYKHRDRLLRERSEDNPARRLKYAPRRRKPCPV